jgi:Domain of unknown function (DUF4180)
MKYHVHKNNGTKIVEVQCLDESINSSSDFLDVIANIPSNIVVLKKEMLSESFFDLKTGLAGNILQKVSNYSIKLGIIGDFSMIRSSSFKDFIFESNNNKQVIFIDKLESALNIFSRQ